MQCPDCSSIVTGQLFSIATTSIQPRFRIQLNSILFAKTLVRKDVASSPKRDADAAKAIPGKSQLTPETVGTDKDEFASKAQIMTLMTTDVDRVSELSQHISGLVSMYPHSKEEL